MWEKLVYSYLERILSLTAILFQDISLKQAEDDFHNIYSDVINDNYITSSILTTSFTTPVYMSIFYWLTQFIVCFHETVNSKISTGFRLQKYETKPIIITYLF